MANNETKEVTICQPLCSWSDRTVSKCAAQHFQHAVFLFAYDAADRANGTEVVAVGNVAKTFQYFLFDLGHAHAIHPS